MIERMQEKSPLNRRIPIILCIDAEPDPLGGRPGQPVPWRGFQTTFEFSARLRSRCAEITGVPARFSWFLRMDPQIELIYGDPTWAITRHGSIIDAVQKQGDELGLHVHTERWLADQESWLIDHGDQQWTDRCMQSAFAAFHSALGRTCTAFRFGNHFMNEATARLLEPLGVQVDLTLEPGRVPRPGGAASRRAHAGPLPDNSAVPTYPFRPSRSDFLQADPARADGAWMIPLSAGIMGRSRGFRRFVRLCLRGGPVPSGYGVLRLWESWPLVCEALDRLLDEPPRYLAFAIRSHMTRVLPLRLNLERNLKHLLRHPRSEEFVFCTPMDALAVLGLMPKPRTNPCNARNRVEPASP